uniref:Uncharacterized protein n=1 Tax=Acrobeloides nanus TaxID=290746 RepID=A0A914C3S6_9BILA
MPMESEAIVEKCENLAKSDVLDLFFTDPYNLMRSITAFKKHSRQFSTNSYRAQIVILNGLLVENIGTITSGNSLKNVESYLTQFDRLVAKSSTLPKNSELEEVQKYARSLLYFRLGDFILVSMKYNNAYDENAFVLALCAYAIALDHLKKGALSSIFSMEAAEILNIVELYVLLKSNLKLLTDSSKFQAGMNDEKLGRKLINFFAKPEHSSLQTFSFIVSDTSHRIKSPYEIPSFNLDILMPKVWIIRHTVNFFERLLWLVSKDLLSNGTLNFMNDSIRKLNHFPDELRMVGIESFTLLDLKIGLFRMSKYVYYEPASLTRLEAINYPYLSYVKPSSVQKKFWESCLMLIDDSFVLSDIASSIRIMSALEEIRMRKENYDTVVLFSTFRWLKNFIRSSQLKANEQSVVRELMERYAQAVLNSFSQQAATSKSPDSIFASSYANFGTSVVEDEAISEEVCIFLAEQSLNRQNFREAESYLLNISEPTHDSETIRMLLFKVYTDWASFLEKEKSTENPMLKEQLHRIAARYKDPNVSYQRLSDINSSYLSELSYKSALDETPVMNGRFSESSFITPTRSFHANETTPTSASSELPPNNRSARDLAKTKEAADLMRVLVNAIQQSRQLLRDFSLLFPGTSDAPLKIGKEESVFKLSKPIVGYPQTKEADTNNEVNQRKHEHFCCGTDSEQEEVLRILENRANMTDF